MRILAVSGDANLITALTSMMRDWEIEHVRDPKAASGSAAGAMMVLVATGSTDKGLEDAQTLWDMGITLPFLVIGDVPPPPGSRIRVLQRPFTLQDLTDTVTQVSEGGALSPWEDPAPAAEVEPEDPAEAEPEVAEESDAVAGPEPFAELEAEPELAAEPEAAGERDAAAEPAEAEPAEAEPAPVAAEPESVEAPAVPMGHDPGAAAPEAAPFRAEEPARPAPEVDYADEEPAKERRRFLRRRVEPKSQEATAEDPTVTRLKAAIVSARDLERLLSELPVLGQPRAMAHAFLGEVVELFSPQVAAVYAPGSDGSYGVIAAHGLSSVEANMKVPPSQPLFMEITTGCEAVLISPVDLAQGLVAGIGGARTEALMVSPLEVSGMCHAVVIVGRQDFSEFDLDLLSELADEAAPGLAVAQLLERLRMG